MKAPFLNADQFAPLLAWRAYSSSAGGVELLFALQAAMAKLEFPKSEWDGGPAARTRVFCQDDLDSVLIFSSLTEVSIVLIRTLCPFPCIPFPLQTCWRRS